LAESGYPGFEIASWYGLLAPAGTPAAIVDRLHHEVVAALHAPEVRDELAGRGMEVVGNTPAQFAVELKADVARWGPIVKAAGIQVE
jgi:tripartite-type tricarboxylate transporter receptor subunit TctC